MSVEKFQSLDNYYNNSPFRNEANVEEDKSIADLKVLAGEIFSDNLPSPEDLEAVYPQRDLPEGAMVTRVGPSPTGYMHIGTLYIALLSERFAHQSDGVFYLRIEDTDKKREVQGATDFISESFKHFNIPIDEGRDVSDVEHGAYGPYTQSERVGIYHTYIKDLLERGLAYPCFSTIDDLNNMRAQQEKEKIPPGYYGKWAEWRDRPIEDVREMLDAGKPYVIRFKSGGDLHNKVDINDLILGDRSMPENNQDVVIMKSDGLPTYHLAHIVDDHLMRTTHVIRGSEWVSSIPLHLQLFDAFGWTPPKYAHIMPIQKVEGTSKRKLSKRKDPEANVGYFEEVGYPPEAVIEYLLNIANSDFEDWRKANPTTPDHEFEINFRKLSQSTGPVFDFRKLDDISKDVLSRLPADKLYDRVLSWANAHDNDFMQVVTSNTEYVKSILSIERGGPNARKDYSKISDIKNDIAFYFDELFQLSDQDFIEKVSPTTIEDAKRIVEDFVESYNPDYSKDEWFENVKAIARKNGFADKTGDYKRNPTAFKGNIADMVKIYRVLLTGRVHTPDLYTIMQVMGEERTLKRLSAIESIATK